MNTQKPTDIIIMNASTEPKPKRQYVRKPKLVFAEPEPVVPEPEESEEEEEEESEEEEEEEESDEELDDEEEEEEEEAKAAEEESDDEEATLLKRLAEVKKAKAEKEAKNNIVELRNELRQYQQSLIEEASKHLQKLQEQLPQIDEGVFDDELIERHISKAKAPIAKASVSKAPKAAPTYEGKGKIPGTGDARAKHVAGLNAGKIGVTYAKKVGGNTWSLSHTKRSDGGVAVMKDSKGVYSLPLLKDIGKEIGVTIKTKKDYIEWVKK